MKKIVTTLALTLCAMHDCSAMSNPIRQNIGRFGQYARQYAQQAAPTTCRTFASRASRPQNFGWVRNLPTYARNVNLPSMRTAAVGLGGLGLGTAAYLQRPELFACVQAEEEEAPSDKLNTIRIQLNRIASQIENQTQEDYLSPKKQLKELRWGLLILAPKMISNEERKNFASIVNDYLTLKNEDLHKELKDNIAEAGDMNKGIETFLAHAVQHDILLINAISDITKIPSDQKIEIPDLYKKFFKEIGQNNMSKAHFVDAIQKIKTKAANAVKEELSNPNNTVPEQDLVNFEKNTYRVLDEISKEIEGKSWWWPF